MIKEQMKQKEAAIFNKVSAVFPDVCVRVEHEYPEHSSVEWRIVARMFRDNKELRTSVWVHSEFMPEEHFVNHTATRILGGLVEGLGGRV